MLNLKKTSEAVKEERKLADDDHEESGVDKEDKLLESTRAAMGEVREENDRLKSTLAQIVKNYQSLQMHFFDIMRQDQSNNKMVTEGRPSPSISNQVEEQYHELVSLSLGYSGSSVPKKMEEKSSIHGKAVEKGAHDGSLIKKEGLTLALDCKVETDVSLSTDNNSSEEMIIGTKEEVGTKEETWPPAKALKNARRLGDEEVAPQADHVKRARVSIRARCDAPTMNDGCQWRKYGQKTAKGNPCPRAYYRCTVAPGCPVRKQVQRCAEDLSILVTTYEGNHNHPLSLSATAMASTTAAAACMLTTGSSASNPAAAISHPPATSDSGLNFSLPDQKQFYLTTPSISPSPSQPTITLDLTSPSNRLISTASRSFYSPASLNFSPLESSNWNYGSHQPYYNSYNTMMALRQQQDHSSLFHSYAQKVSPGLTQNPLTDTIAKAITSDPSFQSALTAAINSYVAAGGGGGPLKWGEQLNLASTANVAAAAGAASIGNLAGSSSGSTQHQGSLVYLQPGFGSSGSKKTANGS